MTWQPGKAIKAETQRFVIKSLRPADITPDYVNWWNDPDIQKGFQLPIRNWSIEQAKAHVGEFDNDLNFHLGIFQKSDSRLVGFFTVRLDPERRTGVPNICIGDKNLWGKHVATEVTRPFLSFFFNVIGLEKVEGHIKGFNLGSISIFRALGFKKEGQLRLKARGIDGEYVDQFVYGLLKEEWQANQEKTEVKKK